jgi:hypothetical protein
MQGPPSHPLVDALRRVHAASPAALEDMAEIDVLWHVACYVVTDAGRLFVQQKSAHWAQSIFGQIGPTRMQSFGGCNFPNSVHRMMNSLRLELMDESGLVLTPENLLRCSPLIVDPGEPQSTLLQVFLVKGHVGKDLWSAETARKVLGRKDVPPEAGMEPDVKPHVRAAGACVKSIDLETAKAAGSWRRCDFESFCALEQIIAQLRETEFESDEMVLCPAKAGTPRNVWERLITLRRVFNSDACAPLRVLSQQPWKPMLWDDASEWFNVKPHELAKKLHKASVSS